MSHKRDTLPVLATSTQERRHLVKNAMYPCLSLLDAARSPGMVTSSNYTITSLLEPHADPVRCLELTQILMMFLGLIHSVGIVSVTESAMLKYE